MSFSVDELQEARDAPKSVPRVSPPVLEALPKERVLDVREETVVVAR